MFILEHKYYFWLLLAIPALILLLVIAQLWRNKAQKKFAKSDKLKILIEDRSWFKPILKAVTISFSILFIVFALVNLKAGTKVETVKREGVDIVFAVDVSKSMLAEDIAPNRLAKSQQLVTQIVNSLASDRIGLIAYAGSAVPQLPITSDYASAKMFLQSLNTDIVSSQGTAIAEAIQLAESYYSEESEANKILVIISDGEDHEGESMDYAENAAEQGIRIITIGVGTERGATSQLKKMVFYGIIKKIKMALLS